MVKMSRVSLVLFALCCLACGFGRDKQASSHYIIPNPTVSPSPTVTAIPSPTPTPTPLPNVLLASGPDHVVAYKNGNVYSWGRNRHGELGNNTTVDSATPIAIGLTNTQSVAASYGRSAHLDFDGKLMTTGIILWSGLTYTEVPTIQFKAINYGRYHALAIGLDNKLYTWGVNLSGQLADGTIATKYDPINVLDDVLMAVGGDEHSLVLRTDGTVWSCGGNTQGELGNGNYDPYPYFQQVMGLPLCKAIYAGSHVSAAIDYSDNLHAWGGIAGFNSATPQLILNGVLFLAIGERHVLAMTAGGLLGIGENSSGQLGDGTFATPVAPVYPLVPGAVTAIACGRAHSIVRTSDGEYHSFGNNTYGQLGQNYFGGNISTPTLVLLP